MKKKIENSLVSFAPVIVVALLGSIFTKLGMDWFDTLIKPSEFLAKWIIPVMWSIIYLIAGSILYVLIDKNKLNKRLIVLFSVNGVLNVLWCLIYFTLHSLLGGLITIVINLIMSILLVLDLKKMKKKYFYLLSIYPLWLSIATCLNLALWILN